MSFAEYFLQQLNRHPSAQPQDVVKLCYQAALGGEHLLTDVRRAKEYFDREFVAVTAKDTDIYEKISDDFCRVNLSAWKSCALPAEWLFSMFVLSNGNNGGSLEDYLVIAENAVSQNKAAFSFGEWENYLSEYKKAGCPAVHHSEQYRKSEQPSYRIVSCRCLRMLPILQKLAQTKVTAGPTVIAIDGRAASGKSTVAKLLEDILGADVIHMDDFFLPPALRCEDRLREVGGNVHYERFAEEVLPHLKRTDAFTYRIFDCGIMDYNGKKEIGGSDYIIVEGSYSCHPSFGNYADITVFSDVSADEQMRRVIKRNGTELAEMFRTRWIPMEEKYFETFTISAKTDIKI